MSATNSPFTKMLDNVFPRIPPFLTMITAQAEILSQAMTVAAEYLSDSKPAKFQELVKLESQAKAMRDKHLDILTNAFSTPIDREDVLQSIIRLEIPLGSMRVVIEEMEALQIKSDNYCLEIAVVMREAASALQRGYSKLDTTPAMADPDAQVGLLCLTNVDKVYRKALAKLYSIDEDIQRMKSRAADAEVLAMMHVVEMLKRREIYRHMRNIAGQMCDAASTLHGIVVAIG
ncbi:MAG: hypothetical protein H7832_02945 [Magnetococcus sp. DMHC-6]